MARMRGELKWDRARNRQLFGQSSKTRPRGRGDFGKNALAVDITIVNGNLGRELEGLDGGKPDNGRLTEGCAIAFGILAGEKNGRLGSSLTAPCGTAVPARPQPTVSIVSRSNEGPPWTASHIRRGTVVLVRMRYGLAYRYIARELPKEWCLATNLFARSI